MEFACVEKYKAFPHFRFPTQTYVACRSPMSKGLPIVGLPRESEGLAIDTFT